MIAKISKDEILKLANFSRLEFSEDEIKKFIIDIENIMEFTFKVAQYKNNEIPCDCNINTHRDYEKPKYDNFPQKEILSGGINKNGFFFIKKY